MSTIDWVIMLLTITIIVVYGVWKTKKTENISEYIKGDKRKKWHSIGLSIMATQASAITFISTPGQAFSNGMGFVQFYFGLPIAMIIISAFFLPVYHKLNVLTAYEYLEKRFNYVVRRLVAFLFLLSRGLAAGITIYAPAIIISKVLDWNLTYTCIIIGVVVIVYTVSGGTKAVSITQKWQMLVIFTGLFIAMYYLISNITENIDFYKGLKIAGWLNKLEIINYDVSLSNRYSIWSGITGGLFLSLSYFGTDQSQVQRYIGSKNINESKVGLFFNGLVKIPMQMLILFIGVLLFVYYQTNNSPIVFNKNSVIKEVDINTKHILNNIEKDYNIESKKFTNYINTENEITKEAVIDKYNSKNNLVDKYKNVLSKKGLVTKDSDYIFINYILDSLPIGIIGFLFAMILSAAMSSTSSEINALASTTIVDYINPIFPNIKNKIIMGKIITGIWGGLAIMISIFAGLTENLIQLVNILGSLFYGTILGVFIVAFFIKKIKSIPVIVGLAISQTTVFILHFLNISDYINVGYLWYNFIGCVLVITCSLIIYFIKKIKIRQYKK